MVPIPESAPYVIVGAGTAAHAACRAIRKRQPDAKVIYFVVVVDVTNLESVTELNNVISTVKR